MVHGRCSINTIKLVKEGKLGGREEEEKKGRTDERKRGNEGRVYVGEDGFTQMFQV